MGVHHRRIRVWDWCWVNRRRGGRHDGWIGGDGGFGCCKGVECVAEGAAAGAHGIHVPPALGVAGCGCAVLLGGSLTCTCRQEGSTLK